MNAWGVSNTTGRDEYTGPSAMPTRPISWYSGSQLTAESSDVVARPAGPLVGAVFAPKKRCGRAPALGAAGGPGGEWTDAPASRFGRRAGGRRGGPARS